MNTPHDRAVTLDRDPLIANSHWETRLFIAESVFDRSYERATAALARWVDGMEAALAAPAQKS